MQPMKPGQSSHPPAPPTHQPAQKGGEAGFEGGWAIWCGAHREPPTLSARVLGQTATVPGSSCLLPLPVFSSKAGGVMEQESIRLLEVGRVQGRQGPRHHVQEKDQKVQEGT